MAGSHQAAQNDIENPYISLANSMRKGFNSLSPPSSECCIYRVPQRLRSVNEKLCTPQDHEARLRRCYGEPIKFSSDEFVTIILVDAAFVIELLLKDYFKFWDENDRIFDKPGMLQGVWTDMWLLENQLPFFILEDLFDPQKITLPADADNNCITEGLSIISLSFSFFEHLLPVDKMEDNLETFRSVAHIVDLFRKIFKLYQPLESKAGGELPSSIPSLTELQHTGVKFEARQGDVELLIEYGIAYSERYLIRGNIEGFTSLLVNSLFIGVPIDVDNFYYAHVCDELNKYYSKRWNKWKAILRQNYFNTPWAAISVIAAVVLLILTLIQTVASVVSATLLNVQVF
ncbi:hypothetical protein L3X38_007871 [Prunus dulcis]|uniref:Uncharacterized protein n=1 Tax=Prunus dulcis TaxID=3755 RepID=A0AAD5F6B3_PRUDU|nr:hypothetical protein L3X38_007871 [Prunus dulcis]